MIVICPHFAALTILFTSPIPAQTIQTFLPTLAMSIDDQSRVNGGIEDKQTQTKSLAQLSICLVSPLRNMASVASVFSSIRWLSMVRKANC